MRGKKYTKRFIVTVLYVMRGVKHLEEFEFVDCTYLPSFQPRLFFWRFTVLISQGGLSFSQTWSSRVLCDQDCPFQNSKKVLGGKNPTFSRWHLDCDGRVC